MKKSAFTLIELVLTVSIISILISFSMYSHSNSNTYMAKQEILNIKKDIEFTRSLAMINRKDSFFTINPKQYCIKCGDYRKQKEIKNLKFLNNSSNISTVSFTKRGATKFSGSGTLVFEINSNKYLITVEPITGRVNLKDEKT